MKWILSTLAVLITTVCALAFAAPIPKSIIDARASSVTILYHVISKASYRAICTGAVVESPTSGRRYILTAGHCFKGDPKFSRYAVVDYKGRTWNVGGVEGWSFNWDKNEDYTIFTSPMTATVPALKVGDFKLDLGQEVYAWQGPSGAKPYLGVGYFVGWWVDPRAEYADPNPFGITTLLAGPGSSGSIVFDADLNARAILVAIPNEQARLTATFIVPLPSLQ